MKLKSVFLLAAAVFIPVAAVAQENAANDESAEIVVTAQRLPGSVDTEVPPDVVLEEGDIASYGASNLTDLVGQLSTQTRTGRGRGGGAPVILVNGRRISSFAEVRDLPPEAIRRVETFPEEVALRYGFTADQRVINFILKDDFRAVSAETEFGGPTSFDRTQKEVEATFVSIGKNGRINVTGRYEDNSSVLESERGLIGSVPGTEDFRTLVPASERYGLNGTYNRGLSEKTAATVNVRYDHNETNALFGLLASDPLNRDGTTESLGGGVTLNGMIGRWSWTGTGNASRDTSDTLTDRTLAPTATRDRATSRFTTYGTNWTAGGALFDLPAGPVTASLRAGYSNQSFRSRSTRAGVVTSGRVSRNELTTRANLDIPIASRNRAVLEPLGDLSVNFNGGYRRLNDFGGLKSYGYGLTWKPTTQFSVIASVSGEEAAPSPQQLGDPLVVTPGVTVFDFTRGETALVNEITGGNALLTDESRKDFKLGLAYEFKKPEGLRLTADYFRNRADNPISSFPILTPELEAALPGRIVRDGSGWLVSIDTRAINYFSSKSDEVRFGINFAKSIGAAERGGGRGMGRPGGGRPPGARGPGGGGGPRGGGGGGRGGGGFGGPFGGGGDGKRVQAAVFYTHKFKDEIVIAPGLPALDLLDGSATGGSGGTSQDRVEVEGGYFNKGLGFRLNASWQSGSLVRGGPIAGGGTASDLRFSDLTQVDFRLFLNFDQRKKLIEDVPFLKGSRVSFRVSNLFDEIRSARDATGVTPLRFQPGFIDPLGRTFEIEFRKLF